MGAGISTQNPGNQQPDPATGVAHRIVARRFGRSHGIRPSSGPVLRLTHRQRELLRKGMAELQRTCLDEASWKQAADEAEAAQEELGIADLAPGFIMWATNTAAIANGAWWLLMPGCGAPVLQSTICTYLRVPWLSRRAEYTRLADAIDQGRYPMMKQVIEWTERVRCALMINVRDR